MKRYLQPHASLALAVVTNDSAYTRFSSSGGGQLPGFEDGADNQYRLQQVMQEFAWQRGGFSFQQEFHIKKIKDLVNGGVQRLRGGLLQAGWFPSEQSERWPEELEFTARLAVVIPDTGAGSDNNEEFTLGANWFFNGHRNKLTMDVSLINIEGPGAEEEEDIRFRVQWDLSL